MQVTSTPLPTVVKPISPIDFADSMTIRIKDLNPAFHCGGKIRDGFIQYGAAYNHCVDLNSKGKSTQLVIPAATGTGKSVSATLYLSQIAKMGRSGLLVVSEVSVAIEAAETINKLAGEEVAGVHYSLSEKNPDHKLRRSIDDLPRIGIITHALFIQRSDSGKDIESLRMYNGKQRDIIIIDERMDLIKRVSFGTDEIVDAVSILKRDSRFHDYAKMLTNINDVLFVTKTNGTYETNSNSRNFYRRMSEDLMAMTRILESENINLMSRIRGEKSRPDSDRANIKDLIRRIIYVVNGRFTHTIEGKNVVCHREEDLSGKFGSVVVLDATSQVNPEYEYRSINNHNLMMIDKIVSRNYSNVTLNICPLNGPRQSKTAIYTAPKRQNKHIEIINCYLKVIGAMLTPDDKLLVVTYKDVVPLFNEYNPHKDQVKFIYWGSKDARGSNEFKDYNKAMVIGWHRKPMHTYVGSVMAINQFDQYVRSTGSMWSDANHLKNMLIVDDMVQFFNRVRCRTAIDNQGNCQPVELYCFTGGNDAMEEVIKSSIKCEMPGIGIKNWKPIELKVLKQRRTKTEERAENFVMWLRGNIEKHDEISLAELRQEFGLQPNIVSRVIKSDIFNDLLEEEHITMTKANGWGNPVRFILPPNKA